MMTGPSGCGKTDATFKAANYLEREVHYFNLGATQDPRSTLIGNTHYNKDSVHILVKVYLLTQYNKKMPLYY